MLDQAEAASTTRSKLFKDRIIETRVGPCALYMLPLEVENVISWRGSFMSNPFFLDGDDLRQGLLVSLLDKGSKRRDRFEIADVLENKGAQLSFHSGGIGVGFSARCLKNDMNDVMEVMAEQLKEPLLEEEEFLKARVQAAASIQRSMERTGNQAYAALCGQIYHSSHPNYSLKPEQELQLLSEITLDSLHDYHAAHFGSNELILVVVGDIDLDSVIRSVEDHLGTWKPHTSAPSYEVRAGESEPGEVHLAMPDKSSIDIRMGHALEVRLNDEEYVPVYLGNFILGGNFSSRLMDTIRDEMGLTYGIRSGLVGISRYYDGHWQVSLTLSQDKLYEGIEATRKLIAEFIQEGATEKELEERKTTLTGMFKVELATTGGLASNISRGVRNGFGTGYLDDFPRKIQETTLEQVNDNLKNHIHLDKAHLAMAGTLPEDIQAT